MALKERRKRTAARAAPMVCFEGSPLPAQQCGSPAPEPDMPQLWRGSRVCSSKRKSRPPSGPEGFQRAIGKPFGTPAGACLLPVGADAPTPAREWDLSSHGTLTLFFRWRKRSVQKKAGGTATSGKRFLLPILTAWLVMSRAIKLGDFTFSWSALVLVFFRRQNGRAFFPPLPIAALLLRRWREAD